MKCWNLSTNRPMSYEGRIKEKRTLETRILSSVPGPAFENIKVGKMWVKSKMKKITASKLYFNILQRHWNLIRFN